MIHKISVEPQEEKQGGEGTAGLFGVPRSAQRVYGDEDGGAVELVHKLARLSQCDEIWVTDERTVVLIFLGVRVFSEIVLPNVDERVADLSCAAAGRAEAEWVTVVQTEFALKMDDEEGFMGGMDGACAVESLDVENASLRVRRTIRDLAMMT
jgi:hypothetical protein